MYTIGKIAKLCNISIKTLRYYDEIGLLKPAFVSPENGYRYYTQQEIQKIALIKYYKELGFKLENIKELILHYELNTLDSYFAEELTRLQYEMEETKRKYFSIKQWQDLIQQGKHLKQQLAYQQIEIKTMPIYSTITFSFNYENVATQNIESSYSNVFVEFCRKYNYYTYGPFMVHFTNIDERIHKKANSVQCYSAIYEQEKGIPEHRQVIGDIPVIAYIHKGDYEQLPIVYEQIKKWATSQAIEIQGDTYERYVVDSWSTQQIEEYVTEVLVPIKRSDSDVFNY